MSTSLNLQPLGVYIDNSLKDFCESLVPLINIACQINNIELSSLKFSCGKQFDINSQISMNLIINNKIPIFDMIIYLNLSTENKAKVKWVVVDNRKSYNETQINFSCLFIYFMVMTRNKAFPDKNELIPNFLMKFMHIPMTIDDIKNCLSENNLNNFQHTWIKHISIKNLSPAIKNRFRQGIAGMRLMSLISNNDYDKVIDTNLKNLIGKIKHLVENGPYWQMHTLFQTPFLTSQSINSNLQNMILEIFSEDKIKGFINSKLLFKYPVYNSRYSNYKIWSDSFFSQYEDKIDFD